MYVLQLNLSLAANKMPIQSAADESRQGSTDLIDLAHVDCACRSLEVSRIANTLANHCMNIDRAVRGLYVRSTEYSTLNTDTDTNGLEYSNRRYHPYCYASVA
jgi:hypothetical protein